jgi:hypothetical protein
MGPQQLCTEPAEARSRNGGLGEAYYFKGEHRDGICQDSFWQDF